MDTFLQQFINGLSLGAIYALIALGYTMVYGILKFINFAHSDVFALGAWMSITVAGWLGISAAGGNAPAWYVGVGVLLACMATCGPTIACSISPPAAG